MLLRHLLVFILLLNVAFSLKAITHFEWDDEVEEAGFKGILFFMCAVACFVAFCIFRCRRRNNHPPPPPPPPPISGGYSPHQFQTYPQPPVYRPDIHQNYHNSPNGPNNYNYHNNYNIPSQNAPVNAYNPSSNVPNQSPYPSLVQDDIARAKRNQVKYRTPL